MTVTVEWQAPVGSTRVGTVLLDGEYIGWIEEAIRPVVLEKEIE